MKTPNRSEGLNIGYYLNLASRHRWLLLAPLCLSLIVGMVLAVRLPRIYEASTLILVQPQRVPERIVTPVVESDTENRISTLSQQILSRSNLERIIDKFKLFASGPAQNMLAEQKVNSLRDRIKVEVNRSRSSRENQAFTVTFRDPSPTTAMQVTNGLAALFIDESLKLRESRATGTTDFLDSELEAMRKRLEEQEELLRKYRLQNMGELPEQLESNLRNLERLNQQLNQREESLRSARVSLAALDSEMAVRRDSVSAFPTLPGPGATARDSEDRMSLAQLKDRLAGLRASYTDQHPDVMRLKARIEQLEKEQASAPPAADPGSDGAASAGRQAANQISAEAARQRTMLVGAIKNLEAEIVRTNQEIREYQRRVEATPKREQELLTIRRDYDNIRASYSSLLNRKLEADIAVNMERKQKGEQFQVIDAARLPEMPVSPDMRKLFLMTLAAGLGIGAGLIFLLDFMDTTVRRLENLEEEIGLPVLAMVPRIFSARDRRRHRLVTAATALSICIALVLTGALALLSFKGVEPTLALVQKVVSI
jgi:polysaccharide chain length determinant protein (PEP-CTERM system associated)